MHSSQIKAQYLNVHVAPLVAPNLAVSLADLWIPKQYNIISSRSANFNLFVLPVRGNVDWQMSARVQTAQAKLLLPITAKIK